MCDSLGQKKTWTLISLIPWLPLYYLSPCISVLNHFSTAVYWIESALQWKHKSLFPYLLTLLHVNPSVSVDGTPNLPVTWIPKDMLGLSCPSSPVCSHFTRLLEFMRISAVICLAFSPLTEPPALTRFSSPGIYPLCYLAALSTTGSSL